MEIRYEITNGLSPGLLDSLSGVKRDETVSCIHLLLTRPGSSRMVANAELGRVFGLLIDRLAEGSKVNLLFPYDLTELDRRLDAIGVTRKREKGGIVVKLSSSEQPLLIRVLEATAFTTFYGWVNGIDEVPEKPAELFASLEKVRFVGVFCLFDESMELLSKLVPPEDIMSAIGEVARDASITVIKRQD